MDRQVKIRGQLVEPAEIESCLNKHPAIASSVALTRRNLHGQSSLIGFFIPTAGQPVPSSAELAEYLAATLPDYMVPSLFVQRAEWPLSAHGKLDHDALLKSSEVSRRASDIVASSTSEATLRELCRRVLGTDSFGFDENLMANGLHSLSAVHLAWLIEEKFGVQLRLSEILDHPTVDRLVGLIERGVAADAAMMHPRMRHCSSRPESIPLAFAQEQVWFLERLHPNMRSYRFQSVLHCRGALDNGVLAVTLNQIVSRHEILRTVFVPGEDGVPRQEIREHVPFNLVVEDLRGVPNEDRQGRFEQLIDKELRRPFDLTRGPLIRWRLFQLEDEEFRLLHTEHHLLHDGWGYGVFLDELYSTYRLLSEETEVPLQAQPAQFADFALWQRAAMASGAWNDKLAYWTRELADCPPPPSLPSDRRTNGPRTFAGAQIRRRFPHELWEKLGQVCAADGVTRFAWILAAFQLFIRRYTGAEDFCVGSGFANRRDPHVQKMLGMVINTLPVRARFSGVATFRDFAERTFQTLRRASDNQEVPFERVVQEVNPDRDANANPFFNTCVGSYEDLFPYYRSDRLEITSEDAIACGQVKFDLMALLIPPKPDLLDGMARLPAPLILWEFSTELFNFSTGQRMLDQFLCLIESSVCDPEAHLSSLSMMDGEEHNRVLELSCGPATPSECGMPVHRIFEAVVAKAPGNSAIAAGETSLSYGQLNVRSNQLARQLVGRGCSAGSLVVVALAPRPRCNHLLSGNS